MSAKVLVRQVEEILLVALFDDPVERRLLVGALGEVLIAPANRDLVPLADTGVVDLRVVE